MATPVSAVIDANGVYAPPYADVLAWLTARYQDIYGADVYLGADSQDGQWLAVLASAVNDSNNTVVDTYNSQSPATAQGNGLSSRVKINGIRRGVPTHSSVPLVLVGVAGTTINNGTAQDGNDNVWNLPATVTIPDSGTVTVSATAAAVGAITAQAGTITRIGTPTRGWQTVNNAVAATPGAPVESDAQLRVRQGESVALPSQTVMQGIVGALKNLPGVVDAKGYENDTGSTDSNGIPAGAMAMVLDGGDAAAIASVILAKKTGGVPTYGSTTQTVNDDNGNPKAVNFSYVARKRIVVAISLHPINNYSTVIGAEIQTAVAAYINGLEIGDDVLLTKLQVPAQLYGAPDSLTYKITAITAAIYPASPGSSDITIGFRERASCDVADITITTV